MLPPYAISRLRVRREILGIDLLGADWGSVSVRRRARRLSKAFRFIQRLHVTKPRPKRLEFDVDRSSNARARKNLRNRADRG